MRSGAIAATVMGWLMMTAAGQQPDRTNAPAEEMELETLEVEAAPRSSTVPDLEGSRERVRKVPGNAQVIDGEKARDGRFGNLEDILELSPSVFIESRFGGSEERISIRGSAVTQTFESRGIRMLRNGLPLNEADGFFRNGLIDPLIVQQTEVYPGANAFEYGAATLGGAVNLITPTGYTADRFTARLEGGSDAWTRGQIAGGGVLGDTGIDGYASLSGLSQNGFREAQDEENTV